MRGCDFTGEKTLSDFIRIVIAVLLVYALWRCAAVQKTYEETEKTLRTLRSEVQTLREKTDALARSLAAEPEAEEIEKLARDRLGLVMPNETIFYFTEDNSTKQKEG